MRPSCPGQRFEELSDISRHAIHVSEFLSATVDTVEKMQQYQTAIYQRFILRSWEDLLRAGERIHQLPSSIAFGHLEWLKGFLQPCPVVQRELLEHGMLFFTGAFSDTDEHACG